MNFSHQDLLSGPLPTSIKSVSFRLPLTPFFNDPGRLADQRTRGFHGDDFFLQNKSTREFKENGTLQDDPICGFEGFRKSVSVDFDEDPPSGTAWSGTLTRAYVFDQDNNRVQAQTQETGKHTIGLTHTRTVTQSNQNDLFIDPGPPPEPDNHVEITLSEPVNKAWLLGELQRWMAEPDEFRDATGTGLGTYSYIGQGATRSESDGFLAIVGGGDVVALGPTFYGTPYGMIGDEAETWNGKFSVWVKKVRRKNAPTLHREQSKNQNYDIEVDVGKGICRQGYTEIELSEALGDVWMDPYGVFQANQALDDAPMEVTGGYYFYELLGYIGEGKAHELTLVSRTGSRYRVTIQSGTYEFDGEASSWQTVKSHVVTTDPQTLQATLKFDEADQAGWLVRVARIEQEIVTDGQPNWKLVADAEDGTDPGAKIGSDVAGDFLLLATVRKRNGNRFGFTDLDYSDPIGYYRKKSFRMHLTTGTVNVDEGSCGGGLSGSASLEYADQFDAETGLELPREVTQCSMTINGKDCTPEDYTVLDGIYFSTSSEVVRTATRIRREATSTRTGRFIVAFDQPDPRGKVESIAWEKVTMAFIDDKNQAPAVALDPPAAGTSLFYEGHRLTYP